VKRFLSWCAVLAMLLAFTGCAPVNLPEVGPFGKDKITVTALMGDSAGLFVGNDVGVLGVTIGKVTSIKPEGGHVRVTMKVDADQPVPAGAGAVVVARSVATDRYVELTPVYHSGPRMKDGAVIEQPKTRTPVDFDDVLAALNTFANGISGSAETKNAIKNILQAGSQAVQGRGEEFNKAITSLGGAVNTISGQRENITATVRSLDTLTGTIAQNQKLVRTFVDQVTRASALLAEERINFQTALRSLSRAITLVADFARNNRQQLVTTLNRGTAVMKALMTKRDQLTETLRVMPVTLQNLHNILHGDRLLVRVDPTVLLPIGGLINTMCAASPVDVCAAFGPSLLNLNNLLQLLGLSK
jgi:phospholipid/cholesterol/gamma-HCH transport system substrate-binding protein